MASREVKDSEVAKYGNRFQRFDVGYDGICIIVSRAVYAGGVKGLTSAQLKDIYAGKIRNWKELKGPDAQIYAVAMEEGSGTRDTFQ